MIVDRVRSREELVQLVWAGTRVHYCFFWGHKPLPSGEIGKSCFSQWWSSPFSVEGVRYATAEHFMMTQKAILFGDDVTRTKILAAGSPKAAKQLGREVKNFNEQTWQEHRFRLVVEGNHAKFSQNAALGEFLLSTGRDVLVEASPMDRIWGIGMAAGDQRATNPVLWRGLNLLGFALMEVRTRLQGQRNLINVST